MKILKLLIVAIFVLQCSSITAQFTKLLDFSGSLNGQYPYGSLISDGTYLYGMTNYGGTNDLGTIFKIKPDGTGFSKLLDFTGLVNGKRPHGSLMYDGIYLYGATSGGGINDFGTLFKIKTDGTDYLKLIDFSNVTSGNSPFGTLVSDSVFLYGTTAFGGINGNGTLFKIKKDGTGFEKLLDFANLTTGTNPWDSLYFSGNFLYGTTQYGGSNNNGVIFKIRTDGTEFTKIYDFGGTNNGKNPFGTLISDGNFLYGTTRQGGTANKGTLFKINTDGSGYTKLIDFLGTSNGAGPQSSLVFDGTNLYGMTSQGGTNNFGILFKIVSDGTNFTKLLDFSGTENGKAPLGSLYIEDNILFGTASNGGILDKGILFKFSLNYLTIQNNNLKSTFSIMPNPTTGIVKIFSENKELQDLTVFNSLGQTVFYAKYLENTNHALIDLSILKSGIYILKIRTSANEIQTEKLIKR